MKTKTKKEFRKAVYRDNLHRIIRENKKNAFDAIFDSLTDKINKALQILDKNGPKNPQ